MGEVNTCIYTDSKYCIQRTLLPNRLVIKNINRISETFIFLYKNYKLFELFSGFYEVKKLLRTKFLPVSLVFFRMLLKCYQNGRSLLLCSA